MTIKHLYTDGALSSCQPILFSLRYYHSNGFLGYRQPVSMTIWKKPGHCARHGCAVGVMMYTLQRMKVWT